MLSEEEERRLQSDGSLDVWDEELARLAARLEGGRATVGGAATVEAASHIAFDNFHINSFFLSRF